MVNDPVASGDYSEEEDPTIYVSQKTERGPLSSDWIKTDSDNNFIPQNGCTDIMCAYKLIRVEFRYWGMQNRIEKFIHDVGESRLYISRIKATRIIHGLGKGQSWGKFRKK